MPGTEAIDSMFSTASFRSMMTTTTTFSLANRTYSGALMP